MKDVELQMIGKEEECFCMTCGKIVSTKVFELREKESGALVQSLACNPFICTECFRKGK